MCVLLLQSGPVHSLAMLSHCSNNSCTFREICLQNTTQIRVLEPAGVAKVPSISESDRSVMIGQTSAAFCTRPEWTLQAFVDCSNLLSL